MGKKIFFWTVFLTGFPVFGVCKGVGEWIFEISEIFEIFVSNFWSIFRPKLEKKRKNEKKRDFSQIDLKIRSLAFFVFRWATC